jgi:hypothetical protein
MLEDGRWLHQDNNGAEYPPAGLGKYDGRLIAFQKSTTVADAAGYMYCTAKDAGSPGAWAPGTPGLNGRVTDGTLAADNGCLPVSNPITGANYLTDFAAASTVACTTFLFDCLWVNSGIVITTTTLQAIASPVLPARDIDGTTNGRGCAIAILCTAAVGLAAVASNATVSYTNSDGVAGRTATLNATVGSQAPATPVIGTFIIFNLQAGDKGVRSIQGITLGTTWVSGTISLMIIRRLPMVGCIVLSAAAQRKIDEPGIRLHNGVCLLQAIVATTTVAMTIFGDISVQEK